MLLPPGSPTLESPRQTWSLERALLTTLSWRDRLHLQTSQRPPQDLLPTTLIPIKRELFQNVRAGGARVSLFPRGLQPISSAARGTHCPESNPGSETVLPAVNRISAGARGPRCGVGGARVRGEFEFLGDPDPESCQTWVWEGVSLLCFCEKVADDKSLLLN